MLPATHSAPRLRWLLLGAFLGCLACSSEENTQEDACLGLAEEPIYGAAPVPAPLAEHLSAAQLAAIGGLEVDAGDVMCSGTLIADGWVLTAAHCEPAAVWFVPSLPSRPRVRVVRQFFHPELDVMLLQLEHQTLNVQPLTLFSSSLGEDWVGQKAVLAGLGTTEDGSKGELLFVEEGIAEVSESEIVVDGKGKSGACVGDSGGPLLSLREGSEGQLLGTLRRGAASCLEIDRYERIDAVKAWIDATIDVAEKDPCGDITFEGVCHGSEAHWCEDGEIRVESCETDTVCGFDTGAHGFRCVESDPCRGVGAEAECWNNSLVRCDAGQFREVDCAACGMQCDYGENAKAACRQ